MYAVSPFVQSTVIHSPTAYKPQPGVVPTPFNPGLVYSPTSSIASVSVPTPWNPMYDTTKIYSPTLSVLSPFSPITPTSVFLSKVFPPGVNQLSVMSPVLGLPGINYPGYNYSGVGNNPQAQEMMIKYFYYKTLDKWLFDDMKDLLGYLKVVGDKVELIASVSDFTPKSGLDDSTSTVEKKADFIGKYVMTQSAVNKLLKQYTIDTQTSWFDLVKHEYMVRQAIRDNLEKRLKVAIAEMKNSV